MVLKKPLHNFFPNFKAVMKLLPTRMALRKTASPESLFKTKTLQFIVNRSMNKITFREYIQKLYGIEVKKVSSANLPGKVRRNIKGRGVSKRPDFKKMFITLPHWVQVPFAPRPLREYEHSIEHDDSDYSLEFRRESVPKDKLIAKRRREKFLNDQYDPKTDPVHQPRPVRKIPDRNYD